MTDLDTTELRGSIAQRANALVERLGMNPNSGQANWARTGFVAGQSEAMPIIDALRTRAESAESERDALRRIIAEAPHDGGCMAWDQRAHKVDEPDWCDCWKSRAEATL